MGRVGHCKPARSLRVESGVPRDSESGGRPPLLDLERPRLASCLIDLEAAWNDGRSLFEWIKGLSCLWADFDMWYSGGHHG